MTVNLNSKIFLETYVRTVELRAGLALDLKVKGGVKVDKLINADFCPLVINYTDRSWNWDWSSRQTTIIQQPAAPKSKKEKEEDHFNKWKLIGSVLTIGAAGLFAFTLKPAIRAFETVQKTREIDTALNKADLGALSVSMRAALHTLVKKESEIDETLYAKTRSYAIVAFGCLTSAAAITTGAFAAVPVLLTGGQILLIASLATGLFATVWYWNVNQDLKPAYTDVVKSAQVLLKELPSYNENMTPVAAPPAYPMPPKYESWAFGYLPTHLQPSAPPL